MFLSDERSRSAHKASRQADPRIACKPSAAIAPKYGRDSESIPGKQLKASNPLVLQLDFHIQRSRGGGDFS
jgi:hypothetical protein